MALFTDATESDDYEQHPPFKTPFLEGEELEHSWDRSGENVDSPLSFAGDESVSEDELRKRVLYMEKDLCTQMFEVVAKLNYYDIIDTSMYRGDYPMFTYGYDLFVARLMWENKQ